MEIQHKKTKEKVVFNFVDLSKKINQISSEIYLNEDVVVHYPRGYEGGQKYKTIKKFTYKGFEKKLPVGVFKSANYGYGFTRELRVFESLINSRYSFEEVLIEKEGKVAFDIKNKILRLNNAAMNELVKVFRLLKAKNKQNSQDTLDQICFNLFPRAFKQPVLGYKSGDIQRLLLTWSQRLSDLSIGDKDAIKELFSQLTSTSDFFSNESLQTTKTIVDTQLIDQALVVFDSIYKQTTDTSLLEKKWQNYLRNNSWIFTSILTQPVILFHDEAYAGGKSVDNTGGKFTDFLLKNDLSDNVTFFEIKTHKTDLLTKQPYRGKDVFSWSHELSGCINQVLNQRDKFQKHFATLKMESAEEFQTLNSTCIVLVGSYESLTVEQRKAFELTRSNSRDVSIMTFDEVRKKIELLKKLINGQSN